MSPTIRKYENKDYLGLYAMHLHFETDHAFAGLPPKPPGKVHGWLNTLLANHQYRHYIIESEKHITGHGVLCLGEADTAEILMFLSKGFPEKDFGRELFLGMLHEACKAFHVKIIRISVQKENQPLLRLADECGFVSKTPAKTPCDNLILERGLGCAKCILDACPFYNARFQDHPGEKSSSTMEAA